MGCGIIPGYNYWVIKGNEKSKKKVQDVCTLVDQLGMLGISEEEFIKTYTVIRKNVKNLRIHHPRFRFETWPDLNLVTITGRETNCIPCAPNDKDQIIKTKMHQEMLVLASLARHSTSASKPTKNSSGPSSHFTNDASKHTLSQLNDSPKSTPPSPKKNILEPIIVPLREHLASCFKELGILEAISSIVEDLIFQFRSLPQAQQAETA
jgi:hypothetical protein